jgi:transposase
MADQKFYYVFRKDLGYYIVNTDTPYWDKEKKISRHNYTMVGKSYSKGGEIIFGPKYKSMMKEQVPMKDIIVSTTTDVGEVLIFKKILKQLNLVRHLNKVFGEKDTQKILSLSYYSIRTRKPLSNAEEWLVKHGLETLAPPRISELLGRLSEDKLNTFFSSWIHKQAQKSSLCYGISSISSYAKHNPYVESGYNRDQEKLKQINLAMLSSKSNGIPLWYTPLQGSLHDSRTLKDVTAKLHKLNAGTFSYIMDRGFYSEENLQYLVKHNVKFIIPISTRVKWGQTLIKEQRAKIFSHVEGFITDTEGKLMQSITVYKPMADGSRAWVHIYYNSESRAAAEERFLRYYKNCYDEMKAGELNESHQPFYDEYFTYGYKTKNGRKVIPLKDPVQVFSERLDGYWCLYTTSEKDARKAYQEYRERNDIEVLFDDLKNGQDCKRLRVHSPKTMRGRLFVQFIALIIDTKLRQMIKEHHEDLKKYGAHPDKVLDRVSTYTRTSFKGKYRDCYSTLTKAQQTIFTAFDITLPT